MRKTITRLGYISLLYISLSACNVNKSITSPSAIEVNNSASQAEEIGINNPPTDIPAGNPIVNLPNPTNPIGERKNTNPLTTNDCSWGNLSAIRCYNPSDIDQVVKMELNTIDCNDTVESHKEVIIKAKSNGYFTFRNDSQAHCGKKLQLDANGSCKNPQFSSQRYYDAPACEPKINVCVPSDWSPWEVINTAKTVPIKPVEPTQCVRTRKLCDGSTEKQQVACESIKNS